MPSAARADAPPPRPAVQIVLMVAAFALFSVPCRPRRALLHTDRAGGPARRRPGRRRALAVPRPRGSVLAVLAVWVLPPVSLRGSHDLPWPWSVPAMIAFALFVW